MIAQTLSSSNLSYMDNWQSYLSAQVPMLWVLNPAYMVNKIKDNPKRASPQEPTLNLLPEDWHFVK